MIFHPFFVDVCFPLSLFLPLFLSLFSFLLEYPISIGGHLSGPILHSYVVLCVFVDDFLPSVTILYPFAVVYHFFLESFSSNIVILHGFDLLDVLLHPPGDVSCLPLVIL